MANLFSINSAMPYGHFRMPRGADDKKTHIVRIICYSPLLIRYLDKDDTVGLWIHS